MQKSLESFQEDILRRLEVLTQHIEDISKSNDENIALLREEVTFVTDSLSSDLKGLKEHPMTYFCAFKNQWTESERLITYDKLLFEYTQNDLPEFDIDKGRFTAYTEGVYTVTW